MRTDGGPHIISHYIQQLQSAGASNDEVLQTLRLADQLPSIDATKPPPSDITARWPTYVTGWTTLYPVDIEPQWDVNFDSAAASVLNTQRHAPAAQFCSVRALSTCCSMRRPGVADRGRDGYQCSCAS